MYFASQHTATAFFYYPATIRELKGRDYS